MPVTMKKVSNLKGPPGDDAYTVAVAAGFTGSRAQWLASLKGSDSTVAGPPGTRGTRHSSGAGDPPSTFLDTAIVGDSWLNTTTGDWFEVQ
jgi:hypothetical protein